MLDKAGEKSKQTSIASVVKNYGSRLFDFIRGRVNSNEDAEDILQDVWYQATNIVDIDSINSISGWLYRVARNRLTDRYRKKKEYAIDTSSTGEEDQSLINALISLEDSPESRQFNELFWEELMAALDELPENQRQVFIWNELEDMTLQEIANLSGENLKTIISRKGYAIKHLRNRLANLYNELNTL
ncbi:MAG: sigma-70 family RNA polymerase sigma factor [Chitinophagaceae bacterium]|nr:sigma-70 family RNA polymerase sigma factor [Chitinophagaceae bacterium]